MKLGFNLKGGLPLSKPGLYLAEIKNNHRVRKRSDGTSCLIIDFEILDSDKKETSSEIDKMVKDEKKQVSQRSSFHDDNSSGYTRNYGL